MKYVKLLTSAYVGGVLRHPHEGVLHIANDEAKRLFDDQAAEDVTADFAGADDAPAESITAASPKATNTESEPHLSEVASDANKAAPARGKAKQE